MNTFVHLVSIERVPKRTLISCLLDFVEVSDWSIFNIFMLIPDVTPKGEFLDLPCSNQIENREQVERSIFI